jgi:hypothetical protein
MEVDLRVPFNSLDKHMEELTELAGLEYSAAKHWNANVHLPYNMPTVVHNAEALKLWCPDGLVKRGEEITRRQKAQAAARLQRR